MSCGASGRCGDSYRACRPLRLTGRGAEGAADGDLCFVQWSYRVRGSLPMPAESPAEGRVQRFGSTVAGAVLDMSAQRLASPHSAGNGGTVTGVGGRDSGRVRCVAWLLTSPDTITMPRGGLAINALVPSSGRVIVPVCRGRSRARRSFPPYRGPAEGSAEGTSREAEFSCSPRVSLLPSGEAKMWCAARGLGREASGEAEIALRLVRPRTSRTSVLSRGPSAYLGFCHLERIWASKHR